MGFWRRHDSQAIDWKGSPCTPVDATQWYESVPDRAPRDGRYYVAWLVIHESGPCLLAEQPASRSEAQRFFKDFARDYRAKPMRANEMHFDHLDGVWVARRRGFPDALLYIIHPDSIELLKNRTEPSDLLRRIGFTGKAAAVENPDTFFSQDWSITRPASRFIVDVPTYGNLLNTALRQGSPLEDLDAAGLDALRDAAQAVAGHQSADPSLAAVDASSLEYLSRRLTQAKIDGMSAAAFFNASDRTVREELRQAKTSADQHAEAALAELQQTIRFLFSQDRTLFENLQIDNSTLTWLYLDDIVDSRDYS
jgi:hypothetical protein